MTHTTLKSLFTAIADAIRGKDGTSAPIVADEFPGRIAAIPTQGTMVEDILISGNGSIDTYANDRVKSIRTGAFSQTPVKVVILGAATAIADRAFDGCGEVTKIILKSAADLPNRCMNACNNLEIVDMNGANGTIFATAFSQCSKLKALALRDTSTICKLYAGDDPYVLAGSNNTACVYVPRVTTESYKAFPGWGYHADRIRALEDYTVDGTITGDLDESKI